MNKLPLFLLLITLVLPASHLSAASRSAHINSTNVPSSTPAPATRFAPRHILVKLAATADVPAFLLHARKQGLHQRGRVYGSNWYTFSIPAKASPRAVAARARHFPGALMATVDPVVRIDQVPPRDPLYRDDDDPSTKCIPGIDEGL